MPTLNSQNKKIILLGVVLLACVGAIVGQYEILGVAVGGLLGILQNDKEGE